MNHFKRLFNDVRNNTECQKSSANVKYITSDLSFIQRDQNFNSGYGDFIQGVIFVWLLH